MTFNEVVDICGRVEHLDVKKIEENDNALIFVSLLRFLVLFAHEGNVYAIKMPSKQTEEGVSIYIHSFTPEYREDQHLFLYYLGKFIKTFVRKTISIDKMDDEKSIMDAVRWLNRGRLKITVVPGRFNKGDVDYNLN